MERNGTFLIVGGGLAAAKAAEGLRAGGFGGHANDWDAIEPVRRIVETGTVDLRALRDTAVPLGEVAG